MLCRLETRDFNEDLLPMFRDFDCGPEPYAASMTKWIKSREPGFALDEQASGKSRVWVYFTPDDVPVGFGSLGVTSWQVPDPGTKPRTKIAVIPGIGIDQRFRGQPTGTREGRYSHQILGHLRDRARELPPPVEPLIGLYVHPANTAAIKLYERFGFRPFHHRYEDRDDGVTYHSMLAPMW